MDDHDATRVAQPGPNRLAGAGDNAMVPAAPDKDARGAAVAQLADLMAKLATAGDLDGARALHETIERLLRK